MAKNNITKFPGARIPAKKKMPQPSDPQLTVNVKNDVVESLMRDYSAKHDGETLNKLVNELVKARILLPANMNEKNKPLPMMIKNKEGKVLLPIYTSKEQIPAEPKSPVIMNIPYINVNKMATDEKLGLEGIVINPFTNNLIFRMPLVKKIEEVEQAKKDGKQPQQSVKQVQMTEPQYNAFERNRFEFGFLPGKLFKETDEFLSNLLEKREEYVDALFEESYQQKRMYPFLPEDFSFMALSISEDVLAISIDMPARDMAVPSCYRIYIIHDKAKNKVRYFTIEKLKEGNALGEVTDEPKHVSHGQAPAEGAELQTILDLMNEE